MRIIKRHVRSRAFRRDMTGITLLLILGISCLTIRIAPQWTLPIFAPMLTERDWLIGEASFESGVEFLELKPAPYLRYNISPNSRGTADRSISEYVTWQKSEQEAANLWLNATAEAEGTPITLSLPEGKQPDYLLTCRPNGSAGNSCVYYAYAGRWYVRILFVDRDSPFPMGKLERLVGLINERLLRKAGQD